MNAFREQIALLDRALTELGFEYRPGSAQVSWRGRWAGRDCVVRAAPQRRTRYAGEVRYRTTVGFRLRAELETSVRTQLFFVREGFAQNFLVRWLYKWRRRTVVPRVPAALRGFAAVTIDPPWAERVLDEPNAMLAVAQLLTEGATPSLAGSVYFAPTSESGRLYYASPIVGLDALAGERTTSVLERLERIADAAERLPAPQVVHEVGAWERFGERYPWAVAAAALFGCLAILGIGAAVLVAVAISLSAAAR